MQQFSRPLPLALAVFCFLSDPNIPKGPEYEKIATLYQCRGEVFKPGFHVFNKPLENIRDEVCFSEDPLQVSLTVSLRRFFSAHKTYV